MATVKSDIWYKTLLTPQTFLYLMGAVVATVIFWYRTQESWAKGKDVENMVTKQWQLQREMNDALKAEIQEIRDWIKIQEGYMEATRDFKNQKH